MRLKRTTRTGRRSALAAVVFVLLGAVVLLSHWYESRRALPRHSNDSAVVNVTNGADRGPGTLREALFIVAAASTRGTISIQVASITLETPLPPLVNPHGLSLIAQPPGAQIDAHGLSAGPVFDVGGPDTSIEGLHIVNCPAAAVLLRAVRFHLQSTTIEACDVGVEVAENASDTLLERNQFLHNRIAIRFAAAGQHDSVAQNHFSQDKEAALWAVGGDGAAHGAPIDVHDNHFANESTGIVAGNVPILVQHNEFSNSREAAIHLVGAAAAIRSNRISGGEAMGIVAESARGAIVDDNEIDGLAAYGIMVRGSADTLLRNNRLHNCAYGIAFVLGDANAPSTAVDNLIMEPKFNGIDVVGDSPILRRNQVLRPHALALHVESFQPPSGPKVPAHPFLDNNNFGAPGASAGAGPPASGEARQASATTP
jgi:parallel beta-helix repeat protein